MGYLVISRRIGERIEISDGKTVIEIMIGDIDGEKVDVGIDAPRIFNIKRLKTHMEVENGDKNTEH